MTVKLEGGKDYHPKDTDPVHCELHNLTVSWGDLDAIQQLAVEEGLDTIETLPCLLLPTSSIKEKS